VAVTIFDEGDFRQKRDNRAVRRPCEFTEKEIKAIRRTEAPPDASDFDHEYQLQW
jgi:hypothetical protein